MLKYLVYVSEDLAVAALVVGAILSFFRFHTGGRRELIPLIGLGASLIAACIMAVMINTTNKVNIGYTNLTMFFIFIGCFLLFLLLNIGPLQQKLGRAGEYLRALFGAGMIFSIVFYSLPDVLGYPYNFNLSGNTVFSTDFIYRFMGCLIGLLLAFFAGLGIFKILKGLKPPLMLIFTGIVLLINACAFAGKSIQILRTRMLIQPSNVTFFIIQVTLNYSTYFILAALLAAVIAGIVLILRNSKVTEEYSNPAQLRKIKAGMRRNRRWACFTIVFAIFLTFTLTWVDAYNNKAPDEAPVEECEMTEDAMVVPLELVSDGHLHRFAYNTDDGIEVKFIVVQKPNSTAYGVGLDACDICGDAGYFERDDEIVCKRCDVVMNKATIGFKGGCNPIVIDYTVENGKIIVPIQTLIDHKDEFK